MLSNRGMKAKTVLIALTLMAIGCEPAGPQPLGCRDVAIPIESIARCPDLEHRGSIHDGLLLCTCEPPHNPEPEPTPSAAELDDMIDKKESDLL